MKRKLVLALIAILAVGLIFAGCSTGDDIPSTGSGKKPNNGGISNGNNQEQPDPDDNNPVEPSDPGDNTPTDPENPDDNTPTGPSDPDDNTPTDPENPDDNTPTDPSDPDEDTPPDTLSPALTKLKTYLASDESGGGTTTMGDANYEQDPFNGNFTGTVTVTGPFEIVDFDGEQDTSPVEYFVMVLTFNDDASGETYEFTLADLDVLDEDGNSIMVIPASLPNGVVYDSGAATYTITLTAESANMILLPVIDTTQTPASFNYTITLPASFK